MEARFDERNHPTVKLLVGGTQRKRVVTAILDTGFDGTISIPITIAVTLGLELSDIIQVQYADGRVSNELVFKANIETDGKLKEVKATLTGSVEALAGTLLFSDKKVTLDFARKSIRITDA